MDYRNLPEPPKPGRFKKRILLEIFFIAFVMIFLFSYGYFVGGYPDTKILIRNEVIPENVNVAVISHLDINTTDYNIYITEDVMKMLNMNYQGFKIEYVLCLYGQKIEEKYIITDVGSAIISKSNTTSAHHEFCPKRSLIVIHNHSPPFGVCKLSDIDKNSFKRANKIQNNDLLYAVQCGINELGIFNIENTDTQLKWTILKN